MAEVCFRSNPVSNSLRKGVFPSAVYRRHFITLQFDLEFVMKITEVFPLCTKLFGPDLATRPSVEEGDAK